LTLPHPSASDITAAAAELGLQLDDAARETYRRLVADGLRSYEVVGELYDSVVAPTPPERAWSRPIAAENPLGAWSVRSEITTRTDGPLVGKRIVVKDNVAVAGIPMMNGSRMLEGFIPAEDATVVTRLLDAGATIVGKATCEDLCFSGSSFTSKPAPVRNPWNRERSTGGSSSGSAALVAAGEVDLAVGADQGGSVRMPAAWCGIVGHKPSYGLVPYTGGFPIERTIDHIGPMGPDVPSVAAMLQVMAGVDGHDPRQLDVPEPEDYIAATTRDVRGMSVGIVLEGFGRPGMSDPHVDETVREATKVFERLGARIGEVSIPIHAAGAMDIWNVIATDGASYQMIRANGHGMGAPGYTDPAVMEYFAGRRAAHADELSGSVKLIGIAGAYGLAAFGGSYYARARRLVPHLIAAYDAALAEYDVLVMPTVPFLPGPLLDESAPLDEYILTALGVAFNTAPFDATGHPASSVPAGLVDGLPVGMMIIGRRFEDATVLQVSAAFERERGEFPRPS
jgi:amidase